MSKVPLLSIGMPVYNSDNTIIYALDSILNQTFTDYEIIISDNNSSDKTSELCEKYLKKDNRIKYYRQDSNIGASNNFDFVFQKARGKYFMWAASDDIRTNKFLEANIVALENNNNFSASTSPNCFEGEENTVDKHVNFELKGSLFKRYKGFLKNAWKSHGIFYSVIRKDVLQSYNKIHYSYSAHDWSLNLFILSRGEVNRSTDGLLVLGRKGMSLTGNPWTIFDRDLIEKLFPLYKFTISALDLFSNLKPSERLSLYYELLKLNISACISNIKLSIKAFDK